MGLASADFKSGLGMKHIRKLCSATHLEGMIHVKHASARPSPSVSRETFALSKA